MKNKTKIITGTLSLLTITALTAFGVSSTTIDKLNSEVIDALKQQVQLEEYNDELRGNRQVLQDRIDKIDNTVKWNSDKWHTLEGRKRQLNETIYMLQGEDLKKTSKIDLDRLAKAVASAETGGGKYARDNNHHGIMTWIDGDRRLKRYAKAQDSYDDFKNLWERKYKVFPDIKLANLYTGSDRADVWLKIVKEKYYD